ASSTTSSTRCRPPAYPGSTRACSRSSTATTRAGAGPPATASGLLRQGRSVRALGMQREGNALIRHLGIENVVVEHAGDVGRDEHVVFHCRGNELVVGTGLCDDLQTDRRLSVGV